MKCGCTSCIQVSAHTEGDLHCTPLCARRFRLHRLSVLSWITLTTAGSVDLDISFYRGCLGAYLPSPAIYESARSTATSASFTFVSVWGAASYKVTKFRDGAAMTPTLTLPQPAGGSDRPVAVDFTLEGTGDYGLGGQPGIFRFEVVALPTCGDASAPATSTSVRVGHPAPPSSAAIANSGTTSGDVVVQFDAPSADLAGGYYLRLKFWTAAGAGYYGDGSLPVATMPPWAGPSYTILKVQRGSPQLSTSPGVAGKWQLRVPRAGLYCGSDACGGGKYSLEEFGALSWFQESGYPADSSTWTQAVKVPQAGLPVAGAFAYYGERRAGGWGCYPPGAGCALLAPGLCPNWRQPHPVMPGVVPALPSCLQAPRHPPPASLWPTRLRGPPP